MTRILPAFLLLQAPAIEPSWGQLLIQLPMVAVLLVVMFRAEKRNEERERAADERQKASEAKHAAMVEKLMTIVEANTAAMTSLRDTIHEEHS